MKTLVIVALSLVTSSLAAQVRVTPPTGGVPTPTGDGPFKRIPNARATVKSGTSAPAGTRRVCRGSQPRGWIAVDYVTDTIACPTRHGESAEYGTAILMDLNSVMAGDEVEVCSGQHIPRNFTRMGTVDAAGRCGTLDSKDNPKVVVIRRTQ